MIGLDPAGNENTYNFYEKYLSDRIDEDLLGKLCESGTMAQ